jgi:hypothetical protein
MKIDLDKRYQTLIGLWFALLMNTGVLFLFAFFLAPNISNETDNARSSLLIFTLTALGTFLVIISFIGEGKDPRALG